MINKECSFRLGHAIETKDDLITMNSSWQIIHVWGADHICAVMVHRGADIPICVYPDESEKDCPFRKSVMYQQ